MGNIRPTYIKRVAKELLRLYPTRSRTTSITNKAKVSELTDVTTSIMRNRIAGYVTRYKAAGAGVTRSERGGDAAGVWALPWR